MPICEHFKQQLCIFCFNYFTFWVIHVPNLFLLSYDGAGYPIFVGYIPIAGRSCSYIRVLMNSSELVPYLLGSSEQALGFFLFIGLHCPPQFDFGKSKKKNNKIQILANLDRSKGNNCSTCCLHS